MTKQILRLASFAITFAFVGCTSDYTPYPEKSQSITITTDIDDAYKAKMQQNSTRLGYNAIGMQVFTENDEVGVYAWTGSKDVAPPAAERVVDNVINKLDGSGNWNPATQMLWKNPVEKHYFLGIYPAPSASIADLNNHAVSLDPKNKQESDILVAMKDNGIISTNKPVNLQFSHIMAYTLISLSYRDQWGKYPEVEKVVLENVATDGVVNYVKKTVTNPTNRHDTEISYNTKNWQYGAVVVPQDGINTIKITIEGKEYVYKHPTDFLLEGGKRTDINLTVGKDKISFGGMSIDSWDLTPTIDANTSGYNPAKYITDKNKLTMIYNLSDLEGKNGRIYEMDYTADYKLNKALEAQITDVSKLMQFAAANLYDVTPKNAPKMNFGAGCSAFAVQETGTQNYLMGRNYDFCHKGADGKETEIAAIVVKTHPLGGKKTVSVVDGYWLGMNRGFMTDGLTDLSMLMAAPYAFMDGMNEDGFAIGVLHLDGKPTKQADASKKNIYMNVAMRLLLDKASNIDEAVALLKQYNMHMVSPAGGSFHFYMTDAKGKYAVVEYVSEKGNIDENPWKIDVLTDNDLYRYVTNFYVSDYMKDTPYGIKSEHGKERYEYMQRTIWNSQFALSTANAVDLLDRVSQKPNLTDPTSHTQWSSLYELSKKKLTLYLLREFYGGRAFEFDLK